MKTTPQTYVLTLHSPSRKAVRIWRGKSLHSLRHCSAREVEHVLQEMQQQVEVLSQSKRAISSSGSYSLNRAR
jgi:hypothetical protein